MNRLHPFRALIAFSLLWASVATAQVATIQYDDTAAVLDRIDAVMTALEDVRAGLDRTAFDAGELGFELAFEDAETITDWVSERIAFHPYAGVLRGPDGTLRARAGNAFDQALLLARLLNDAGYETRIAVATLAESEAERLLDQAAVERSSPADVGDVDAIRSGLAQLAELLGDEGDVLSGAFDGALDPIPLAAEDVLSELRDIEADIVAALQADAVELGVGARAALAADVARYAWTEYRFGTDDPWTAAHPTGFQPEVPLEAEDVITDTVPEAYQHRVRIEAWIEARSGGELAVEPVMAPWERPVALVDHVVVDYANVPDQGSVGTGGEFDLAALADGAQAFVPYLSGNLARGARIFDLDGRVLEPDVANADAAGVFRAVAGQTEGALGALGSIGSDAPAQDAFALTGHGIDITFIAPGGEETLHRRWIVDRIGPEMRAAGEIDLAADAEDLAIVARSLLGRHRIMVSTGSTTPAFLLDRTIERLLETRALLELMATNLTGGASDLTIDAELLPASPGLDHLGVLDAFDRVLADVDAGPGYRPEPAVLILSETVTPDGEGFRRSVDIVDNPRRILTVGSESVDLDVRAAMRRGAWETMVEREMLLGTGAAIAPVDRVESLAAADVRGPYTVLTPGATADPQALGVDATAAARIQEDVDRGAVVVLGTLPEQGAPAWWRVDPISGATLGITADGRGQTVTEYIIQTYDNAFTLMFAVKGISDCLDVPSGPPQACCLLKAHMSNVAGLGLGSIVGSAYGSGAGLIFGLATGVAGVDWSDGMGLDCAAFGAGY